MRFALVAVLGTVTSASFADGHLGVGCIYPAGGRVAYSSFIGAQKVSDVVVSDNGDQAYYATPTDIYKHGILGDAIEAGELVLQPVEQTGSCPKIVALSGDNHVFEDTKPRFADMEGDGVNELIAVRTSLTKGAQLVVYRYDETYELKTVAFTDYIGRSNRWLAPIGAADLDDDGRMEIAYIDRPHLAKTLRIVSIQGDQLVEEAAIGGLTNHRIGERDIAGGVRDCGHGPEIIVASADWLQLLAVTYNGDFTAREIGRDTSRPAFAQAMACQ